MALTTALPVPSASADQATGGSGRFKSIEWFSWGAANEGIPNTGLTRTQTYTVAGQTLAVTCTLSNIAGGGATGNKLQAYRPGDWRGDGFDDLYNIGGTGASNQLVVGLANTTLRTSVTFNFGCSASLAGQAVDLSGLVMADAESSGSTEFIQATIPNTATWRLIDRVRGASCAQDAYAQRTQTATTQTLKMLGPATNTCEQSDTTSPAPSGVAFMEDATAATNVTIGSEGVGRGAIALGVALDFEFGDAPSTYGQAGSGVQFSFSGGTIPLWDGVSRGSAIFGNLSLASAAQPTVRLGAAVDPELSQPYTAQANGDDLAGSSAFGGPDDEDAVTLPATVVVTPGQTYTLPNVRCSGTNPVAGWLDFDLSGTFDADERSGVLACNNTSVNLTWTVPADAVPGAGVRTSFLRLRTVAANTTPLPTGMTGVGEVEDHQVNIALPPQLTVAKEVAGRVSPADQFTVAQSGAGLPAGGAGATTSGTNTSATTGPQVVQTGQVYTMTDVMAAGSANPLSDYVPTVRCIDAANSGAVVATTTISPGRWTVSNLQNGQDVRCTATNTPRAAALDVSKTGGSSTGPNAQGQYSVTYQVQVTNSGALGGTYGPLTDTPGFASNIAVESATWTTSGPGAPAGGQGTGSGPFILAPAGSTIARDTTHTYNLTVNYHYTDRTTATACAGAGTGLFNRVALAPGQESGPTTNNTACVQPSAAPNATMTLAKDSSAVVDLDGNGPDTGDRIDYTFRVTNTGNVNLTGLTISDPLITGVSCPTTSLAPGASTTCTGNYLLTLADAERGSLTNVATANAKDPQGGAVQSPSDDASTAYEAGSSLLFDKVAGAPADANGSGRVDAGDTISYQFSVTNTGSVTIGNIAVNDNLLAGITCATTTLAPGASTTCTAAPYLITQADVDAGSVNNAATASGTRPGGVAVTSNADATSTALNPKTSLFFDKQAAAPIDVNNSGLTDAGDTIRYNFLATNTGTVTLTNVSINDSKLTDAGIVITCAPTTLAPGATANCTSSRDYVIISNDVAAGVVANTATAASVGPGGVAVTSPADSTSTPTTMPQAKLSIDKVAAPPVDANNSGLTDVGDTIAYSFSVTNNGNVPLRQVAISDAKLTDAGLAITCPAGPLAPGATVACEVSGPYRVTSVDLAAGSVANTATASGIDPDGRSVSSGPDTTSTPTTTPRPSLSIDKQAGAPGDMNNSGLIDAGDTIVYSFVVSNTGNVPVRALSVTDTKLADAGLTVACPAGPLAPGASVTCTASGPYVITASDVASGSATNAALASGLDADGGTIQSPVDTTSTSTTTPTPKLSIDKQAGAPVDVNNSGITDAGDTIAYTFAVTNTGNVPVRQVVVNDPRLADAGLSVACPTGPLAPGASVTCTVSGNYVVTESDEQAGAVANTATASGLDADGGALTSPSDSTSTPATVPQATLLLDKTVSGLHDVDDNGADAGDELTYGFAVTNTGNVPLNGVSVNDPTLTAAGITITCPSAALAPGAKVDCVPSSPYSLTAEDLNTGFVTNTATAGGADPDGGAVQSGPDSTSTRLNQQPGVDLVKSASTPDDVNGSGITDAGDQIGYSFTVYNFGNVTLSNVVVTDAKLAAAGIAITCPSTSLIARSSMTCVAARSYTITAADVTNGVVANTATATATSPTGTVLESPPSNTATPTTNPQPGLKIDKSAGTPVDVNGSGLTDAGDTIEYSFVVTNTGNVPIANVMVNDSMLGAAGLKTFCPVAKLAPGASVTCVVDNVYTVTSRDAAAGSITNTATAEGTNPDGGTVVSPPDSTATPTTQPAPSLSLDKRAATPLDVNNSGLVDVGDTIGYGFVVTNTGNVPVTTVRVIDRDLAAAGIDIACPAGPLAPGASVACTPSAAYVITAADVDAGVVDNLAFASAADPDGQRFPSPNDTISIATTRPAPGLAIDKRAADPVDVNNSGLTDAGDTIAYAFTVTNTGNVPLAAVTVTDPMLTAAGISVACPTGPLAPGASVECSVSGVYVVRGNDVQNGTVINTAAASATDPDGGSVKSADDSTATGTTQPLPNLKLDKIASAPVDVNVSGLTDAGDTITYSFSVTNSGNVPVRQVAVNDQKLADAGITVTCPSGPLAPGAAVTCTSSAPYVVTAADVERGSVTNTATASGADPDGGPVTSAIDDSNTPTTQPLPALVFDKQAASPVDVNNSGLTDAGDTIDYTFTVTNTGNVPLRQVSVNDQMLTEAGLSIDCPSGPLAPAATVTCTASRPYVITEADETAGTVTNTARAASIDPDGGEVTSPTDSTATPVADPAPRLLLDKQAATPVDVNGSGVTDAGDTIAYTFVLTNTGNVPLRQITVNDQMLTGVGLAVECPVGPLAPGASVTCTVSGAYTVTAADEAAGRVENTATATSIDPNGTSVDAAPDSTITPTTVPGPALTINKRAAAPVDVNSSGITDAGDTIVYSFTVINNGNVPIRNVTVNDAMLADAELTVTCPTGPLAPTASVECAASGPYVIAEADEQVQAVRNTATASGIDPDGGDISSPESSTTTPVQNPAPSLAIDKQASDPVDANSSGLTDAGDEITYSFTVTNTGNVPVREIAVSDAMLADAGVTVTCPQGPLAPGASVGCTVNGPYRVSEDDEQSGAVVNTARARAIDPDGGELQSFPDSTTTATAIPNAGLSIDKQAREPNDVNGSGLTDAGDTIAFTFAVTNIGNVPIRQVVVTDPMLSALGVTITCPAGPLAPGESVECLVNRAYVISEDDEQAGAVVNIATAAGVDPDDTSVRSLEDSVTVPTAVPVPSLLIDKRAASPVDLNDSGLTDAGDEITYAFTVTNNGNVPIRQINVSDATLTDAGVTITCPAGPLLPGSSSECTVSGPYVVSEGDERAGAILNTATASGIDPDGAAVGSPEDSTTTRTTVPAPELVLDKVAGPATDVNSSGITDAGDTIVFTFTVTNGGNVPVRQIRVDDTRLVDAGVAIACPAGPLAPGSSTECTASGPYVVGEADEQAGSVGNTATAAGADPDGGVVRSPEDSTSTQVLVPSPVLGLVKRAGAPVDANSTGRVDAGDTVEFTFSVTNNGNVMLRALVIADPMLADSGVAVSCPAGVLAPGASATCTSGAYVLTQPDLEAGVLANTATAGASDPDGGGVSSQPSSTATPLDQVQSLRLVKSAQLVDGDGDGLADARESIDYSFVVTNTGNVRITDLVVNDAMLSGRGVSVSCPETTLDPSVSTTCMASMVVTAEDQTSGSIVNVATASGAGAGGAVVNTERSQAQVPTGGSVVPSTSASPTPTPAPSVLPTATVTPTPSPTPTATFQPTSTVTPSASPTKRPTRAATVRPTTSPTATKPTKQPTPTPSPTEGPGHGILPNTGGPAFWQFAGGLSILVLGLALLFVTRRRRS